MRHLPPSRLTPGKSKARVSPGRWLTPLEEIPPLRICEDVYPGDITEVPRPRGKKAQYKDKIQAPVFRALRIYRPEAENDLPTLVRTQFSLCTMLVFSPPPHFFSALGAVTKLKAKAVAEVDA